MSFVPRLTAPSADDPYWISTLNGGLNECIRIDADTGSVLPNCVGYAWGRFYELTGERPELAKTNADTWFGYIADGYQRSSVPKLGAVACWAGGSSGHVAVVEELDPDGTITTSNSDYYGDRFYLRRLAPGYILGSGYSFQGFIYPPHYKPGSKLPPWLLWKAIMNRRGF